MKRLMQSNGEVIQESVAENKIKFGSEMRKLLQKIKAVLLTHVNSQGRQFSRAKSPKTHN